MKKLLFAILAIAMLIIPVGALAEDMDTVDTDDLDLDAVDTVEDDTLPDDTETIEEPTEAEIVAEEEDAGVTPDSPLWGIDVALDKIRYKLTFNKEKKAALGLEIAEERLAEMSAMGRKNKVKALEKAEKAHGETLEEVEDDVEAIDGEAEGTEKIRGIENGMANHLAALAKVKARIAANENIPEATRAKLEMKFTSLEARAEEVKMKVLNKKEQIKIKLQEKIKQAKGIEDEAEEVEEPEEEEEETEEPEEEQEETEDQGQGQSGNQGNTEE